MSLQRKCACRKHNLPSQATAILYSWSTWRWTAAAVGITKWDGPSCGMLVKHRPHEDLRSRLQLAGRKEGTERSIRLARMDQWTWFVYRLRDALVVYREFAVLADLASYIRYQ
ncbi:MAG: hypothetical protein FRX48_04488 [Lasallia pustulata]|uniref:Uncharacterized protein n=1 Tax=Lasallia pustulata TaxID=136370 RepID=A0A5M8PUI9_9LECA|nr:MAG: hypothetical protein FRX48_04488 [Lasallia pustulata]